jgi:Fe-S cluster assembly ATP-binding protein
MGPNGSGKSTLSSVLVGNPAFEVTEGEVIFNGKNLLDLSPEDRSREGIFLSFQYPVEIPGVSMVNFMRAALNEHRKYNGLEPVSATDFLKLMREKGQVIQTSMIRKIKFLSRKSRHLYANTLNKKRKSYYD